jgi:hypothetical protein
MHLFRQEKGDFSTAGIGRRSGMDLCDRTVRRATTDVSSIVYDGLHNHSDTAGVSINKQSRTQKNGTKIGKIQKKERKARNK